LEAEDQEDQEDQGEEEKQVEAIQEEDREDDEEMESPSKEQEEEKDEPYNLDDLRISKTSLPNELEESLQFFEELLKESYGEARFKKALEVMEKFEGDRFVDSSKLIQALVRETFTNNEEQARGFLHECSSFMVLREAASCKLIC